MKNKAWGFLIVAVSAGVAFCLQAQGQAIPTASRRLQIAGFGGITGTYTGLNSGRTLGVTAGADFGFRPFFSLYPSVEVRGSYVIDKGQVDSQKAILGGLKVEKPYGRFHPYADFLFGRGQINYGQGIATPDRNAYYVQSFSNVVSPGIGIDFQLNESLSLKADGQFQRFSTPVTESGHLYSKPLTLGVEYRFSFERRRR